MTKIKMTFVMLFLFFSLSQFTIAQTKNNDVKLLQGKWILQNITVHDGNNAIAFNIDSLNIMVHSEIEIQQDMITFVHKNNVQEGKYVADNNSLYFSIPPMPICVEWRIFENKLYIEQGQDMPDMPDSLNEFKTLTVTSIYKRK